MLRELPNHFRDEQREPPHVVSRANLGVVLRGGMLVNPARWLGEAPARRIDVSSIAGARKSLQSLIPPQLTTLEDAAPAGDALPHEVKVDGYRMLE